MAGHVSAVNYATAHTKGVVLPHTRLAVPHRRLTLHPAAGRSHL